MQGLIVPPEIIPTIREVGQVNRPLVYPPGGFPSLLARSMEQAGEATNHNPPQKLSAQRRALHTNNDSYQSLYSMKLHIQEENNNLRTPQHCFHLTRQPGSTGRPLCSCSRSAHELNHHTSRRASSHHERWRIAMHQLWLGWQGTYLEK